MIKLQKNWLEWCVFGASLVLVLAVLGYLSFAAWDGRSNPPALEIQIGQAKKHTGHYTLPVTVFNHGDETAEAVHVRVRLDGGDGHHEEAQFEIQFLPGGASRRGWVAFQSDPAQAEKITARPLGYQHP